MDEGDWTGEKSEQTKEVNGKNEVLTWGCGKIEFEIKDRVIWMQPWLFVNKKEKGISDKDREVEYSGGSRTSSRGTEKKANFQGRLWTYHPFQSEGDIIRGSARELFFCLPGNVWRVIGKKVFFGCEKIV